MLWAPSFHNTALPLESSATFTGANIFYYSSNNAQSVPLNTAAIPFGSIPEISVQSSQNTAATIQDPASNFVDYLALSAVAPLAATAKDARCLSACMRMRYTGTRSNASGEFCFIENLPGSDLMGRSVDSLFATSTRSGRIGVATQEVVFRGDTSDNEVFRNGGVRGDTAELADGDYSQAIANNMLTIPGVNSGTFTTFTGNRAVGPRLMGIAWRGINNQAPLSFEMYKNFEWRPANNLGLTESIPRAIGPNTDHHKAAIQFLDNTAGVSWSTRTLQAAGDAVSRAALSGLERAAPTALNYIAGQGMRAAGRYLMPEMGGIAAESMGLLEAAAPLMLL